MRFHGKGTIKRANEGLQMLVDSVKTKEERIKTKKIFERYNRIQKMKEEKCQQQ